MTYVDVVNLFTNIPLQDLDVSYILVGNKNLKDSKTDLTKLFQLLLLKLTFFLMVREPAQAGGSKML